MLTNAQTNLLRSQRSTQQPAVADRQEEKHLYGSTSNGSRFLRCLSTRGNSLRTLFPKPKKPQLCSRESG